MKFIFLLIALAAIGYFLLQNTPSGERLKTYFGSGYSQVNAGDLFSTANLYNGKKVCAKGYYIESAGTSVLKATIDAETYHNSAWVVNSSGKQIFVDAMGDGKWANAKLCG